MPGLPRHHLLVIVLIVENGALLAALLLSRWLRIHIFPLTDSFLRDIVAGSVFSIVPLIFFLFSLSARARNIQFLNSLRRTVVSSVAEVFSNAKAIDLVMISLLAGFAEEIFFRGVLQVKFGIVIASILFGLAHFITPAYAVMATVMGFYIGALFEIYGSLLVPIQLHFVYDLGALFYLKYFPGDL